MKERTKETLRDGFGVLVNNAAAIRGAKNGPLWLTIVMFVLALFLPILPIFITQLNVKGSSFLNTYTYGLEKTVTSVAMDLKNNRNVVMSINDNHEIDITENGAAIDYSTYDTKTPFAYYTNEVTGQYDLVVYVSDATKGSEKKAVNNAIKLATYTVGTTTKSDEKENVYTPSYIIIYKNGIYTVIYGSKTTKAIASSYSGDFKTMKPTNVLDYLLTVNDKDGNAVAASLTSDAYTNGVLANFKKGLDKSYETLKVSNVWGTSGIYLGIFAGVNILMGFIIWILTRGKNNPNNYFSIWLTMKIQARMALSPAIITAIVGIFLIQYVPIAYVLLIGLRVMWISMKDLRPQQA